MVSHKRILVADDEPTVLFVFENTLKTLDGGVEIITAQNGLEALRKFEKQACDLVITDLNMPGMDGIELTKAIKSINPDTAVIWITAYGCPGAAAAASRLGVTTCRDKPVEMDEILRLAESAFRNSG